MPRGELLEHPEVRRGIEQPVGMIDANAVDLALAYQLPSSWCVAANTSGSSTRSPASVLTSKKRR